MLCASSSTWNVCATPSAWSSRAACAVLFAALCAWSSAAPAAPITVAFDGVISSQGSFVDDSGTFAPGDPISGFWTFDSATPDGDLSPSRGEYAQSGAPAFQINVGGHTFSANTATVQILDDHALGIGTIDAYDVLSAPASSTLPGLVVNQMQITLRDTAAPLDAVTSDALPLAAPNPASFDQQGQAAGQITGFFPDGQLFMNLEILSTRVVPEPSGWLLAGMGLAALISATQRRTKETARAHRPAAASR
ncbi:MAG: PEP-CTERM sorting domain-containing protein [Pirellulales bacterium]